ncbi:MAG: SprT-like domain-containing protein [Candidatus Woesearchaeota archaeon]
MELIKEAFEDLYPERPYIYESELKYSDKFNDFNGNIHYYASQRKIKIGLSKKWRSVDKEIRLGMIQELLLKMFKGKKKTRYIDYYHIFMKKVHLAAPKTRSNPILEQSFNELNERFFFNNLDPPNLVFSGASFSKLGSYEYGSDTINISSALQNAPKDLLDYVLYHEMLHKRFKFDHKDGKSYYHTPEFKRAERMFDPSNEIENRLGAFLSSNRIRSNISKNIQKPSSFIKRLFKF